MLIIALVGGNEEQRASVAQRIESLSAHIAIFDMRYPLDEAARLKVLNKVINTRHCDRQSLLLLSVKSEKEAQLLRTKGVIFAFLDSRLPEISVREVDLFVTSGKCANRHYLMPESMFSEARILYQKRRKKCNSRNS